MSDLPLTARKGRAGKSNTGHVRRGVTTPTHNLKGGMVDRLTARRAIVIAAEKVRESHGRPYSMRRLQQAVCVVRRKKLVEGDVLVAAGFREKGRQR